jgi:hypothetical protein
MSDKVSAEAPAPDLVAECQKHVDERELPYPVKVTLLDAADTITHLRAKVEMLELTLTMTTNGLHKAHGKNDRLTAENEWLRAVLKPFANALKGNWSHQPDHMPLDVGHGPDDLRLRLTLGDFRRAHAALQEPRT